MTSYRDEYAEIRELQLKEVEPWSFSDWLNNTLELQRDSFDTDPPSLKGDERADYILWNITAAQVELAEALQETQWKPWGKHRGGVDRDKFVEEIVDVMHFLANILCCVGVSGEELTLRYDDKRSINAERQSTGYDGVTGVCEDCGLDLKSAPLKRVSNTLCCGNCGAVARTL